MFMCHVHKIDRNRISEQLIDKYAQNISQSKILSINQCQNDEIPVHYEKYEVGASFSDGQGSIGKSKLLSHLDKYLADKQPCLSIDNNIINRFE